MDTVRVELKENWRFHLGECEEAWYKGYDDSSWRQVMVPHDWSVEAPFSKTFSSGTGYLQGGIGWYRTRFFLPEEYRGKKIRICFDGVYKNSRVFCNSYYLGKRPNGYISFSYDISDMVVFGQQENEISVKVVHEDLADSRWFTGSGVTRKVTLLIQEPVNPTEYGCTFRTEQIVWADQSLDEMSAAHDSVSKEGNLDAASGAAEYQAACARVMVTHEPVNESREWVNLSVKTVLLGAQGDVAAELVGETSLEPGEKGKLVLLGNVENPLLWSPETPNLYRMQSRYCVNGGEAYLVHEEKVGIRSIAFVPDKGFFLNGRNRKIKGVCVHHDGGCLGAAMKAEVWQRRLALLKACGCNAIRCSHNPHMPELYGLCDAMGFLVMDEAFDEWENPKNKWSTGHNVYPPKHQGYYEDFPAWHDADLRAMVRRDRNHPSVILWSIGNEIDYPNDPYCHPMFETMTGNNDANKPEAERRFDSDKPNMERLSVLAAELAGIVREEDGSRPVTVAAAFPELSSRLGFFDALSVVGYNYKEHLYEEDHQRFPEKTFLGSENSHSDEAWQAVVQHPYICGQFLWTGIDYLGEAKGWPVHGSPAGILTTAGFPKPGYDRRKAMWQEKMTVLDEAKQAEGEEISSFETVKAGTDVVSGMQAGQPVGITACVWKEKDLLSGQEWEKASGEVGYLYQILVKLVDQDGEKVLDDDQEVKVQVQGDGQLAGIDNGNLADVTPFSDESRKTFRGDLAVYVRRIGDGEIQVFLQPVINKEKGKIVHLTFNSLS